MSLTMHRASVAVLIRGLRNLADIIAKGEAHAAANNIDPADFIAARLAPDMHGLAQQVQLASDSAKGCGARLSGADNPSFPDTEKTFPELQARIAKTIAFLESLDPAQFLGSEEKTVVMKVRGSEISFAGHDYLFGFALPNFYFHVTTAYDILRHQGVALGKLDYLGVRLQAANP